MRIRHYTHRLCLIVATTTLVAGKATAADTLELFEPGLSDAELYSGVEGLGGPAEQRSHFGLWLLGLGVSEDFSAFAEGGAFVDGTLYGTDTSIMIGGFATPVDGAHFGWDVGMATGSYASQYIYAAFSEFNLDAEPDQGFAGIYARLTGELSGRDPATEGSDITLAMSGEVGAYWSLADSHQLFLQLDGTWRRSPALAERRFELGAAHVGYNFGLSDSLELINEVSADIPQRGDDWRFGAYVGIIATLGPVSAASVSGSSRTEVSGSGHL